MKNLSYDTKRTIDALNKNQKVSICRNGKIFNLELTSRDEYGDMAIILRNQENIKNGLKFKIHYTEIAKTLNNIFEKSAINEIV